MAGNIAEWVFDRHAPYSSEEQRDPVVTSGGMGRVYRGGSWASGSAMGGHVEQLRTYFRALSGDDVTYGTLGVRCARSTADSAAAASR